MNKRVKKIIPYCELLIMVRGILEAYPECRNIHIDGIEVNQEQNDGANWNITRFRKSGSDNDLTECRSKIHEEICVLRASYDVAPKA